MNRQGLSCAGTRRGRAPLGERSDVAKRTESEDTESVRVLPGWQGAGGAHHPRVTLVAWLGKERILCHSEGTCLQQEPAWPRSRVLSPSSFSYSNLCCCSVSLALQKGTTNSTWSLDGRD